MKTFEMDEKVFWNFLKIFSLPSFSCHFMAFHGISHYRTAKSDIFGINEFKTKIEKVSVN
jgi:hypothetical protein